MTKNNVIRTLVMCSVMAGTSMMFAQGPAQNIDPNKHPNLASAQTSIAHAYQKIDAAQQANRDRLGDHAREGQTITDPSVSGIERSRRIRECHQHK